MAFETSNLFNHRVKFQLEAFVRNYYNLKPTPIYYKYPVIFL